MTTLLQSNMVHYLLQERELELLYSRITRITMMKVKISEIILTLQITLDYLLNDHDRLIFQGKSLFSAMK